MSMRTFGRMMNAGVLMGLIGLSQTVFASCSGVTRSTTEIRLEPTNQRLTYIGATSALKVLGIDTIEIDGFILRVRVGAQSQYVEYEAPGLQRIEATHYEAEPVSTLISNVILVGLPLLVNPKRQLERLGGCTNEQKIGVIPDEKQQQPTGKKEWRSEGKNQHKFQLIVEGLSKPVVMESLALDREVLSIDLKDAVMATSEFPVVLKVACTTCQALDNPNEEPFGLGHLKLLPADFSKVRDQELAAQQRLREEEIRRQSEQKAAEARTLAEQRARETREHEARKRYLEQQRTIREQADREAKERQRKMDATQQLRNL